MANVQHVTEFPFRRFALVDETLSAEIGCADCVAELDFDALAGCETWAVYGEFEDCTCGVAWVDQRGFGDRIGRIRRMVQDWLCRLARSKRLYAVDNGGGLDFPDLRVERD
jgi:hypothetical protein